MNTLKNLLRKGITIGSFCLVSGTILSAQISLSMQNKSTREVIREIEKVSDYRFFYNDNLSGLNTKISVSARVKISGMCWNRLSHRYRSLI